MSPAVTLDLLAAQIEVAETLRARGTAMFEPQDLPGRFGRVIEAFDRVVAAAGCEAVVAGGWAVWRHGYLGRITQDVDIVVPADQVDELLRIAAVSGFEVIATPAGLWPKLVHNATGVSVDLMPEGARPGTPSHPAPTTIPHPSRLGAKRTRLAYVNLASLIELKLAAGRARDESDVVELLRANPDSAEAVRHHLASVNDAYALEFDNLLARAQEQADR
jgi:hypothetical protein